MNFIVPRTCVEVSQENQNENPKWFAKPLESFRSSYAYILLGDPGSGKSTAFEVEAGAAGENAELISARDFITFNADRHPEWRDKTLFIDGLDEVRLSSGDEREALDKVRRQLDDLGCPRFRISCREADWLGDNDRKNLRLVSPGNRVPVLRLNPLTEGNIREILEAHPDVGAPIWFLAEARRRRIDGLLANPLTLEMLIKAVAGVQAWPGGRLETFAMACQQMATEFNEEHQNARLLPSADALMKCSARLCAHYLIAGAAGYSISYSESDPDYIALENCDEGEPETERLALATRLFTSVGGGRFVPAHRHIAEFLGAWHLAHLVDGGLPIGRVLAMVTAGDGSVVPVFRGLSAWLAAHCTGARSSLIESDPVGVGIYGDLQNFSTGDKRSLLWALNPEVANYGVDVLGFTSLATSDMETALWEFLSDGRRDDDHQYVVRFLLRVLSQSPPLAGLSFTLLKIVYDNTCWRVVSNSALQAFAHISADSKAGIGLLKRILVDIVDGNISDPDGQLVRSLLPFFGPRKIDPTEILRYLAAQGRPDDCVEYLESLGDSLLQQLTDSNLGELLDHLYELMPVLEDELFSQYVNVAPVRILVRALHALGDEQEPARLYNWLSVATYITWDDRRIMDPAFDEVRTWLEQRPAVQKAVLLDGLSRCPDDDNFERCAHQVPARLHHSDAPSDFRSWCLDTAVEWADRHGGVAVYLLKYAVYLGETQSTEEWITQRVLIERTRGHPALERNLAKLLETSDSRVPAERADIAEMARIENERQQEQWVDDVRANADLLRENRATPELLHEIAIAYFGHVPFAFAHRTSEPGLAGLLPSADLLEASTAALRGTVGRPDVPEVPEIIRRSKDADPHLLGLPFLAGMDEIERVSRDQVDQLSLMQMQQAVAFYFCIPTNRRTEPEWFLRWASSRPEMVADVLVQCAAGIGNATGDVCDLDKVLHQEDYSAVAASACLPILREFPVHCEPDHLEWLDQWLWYAVGHADRKALQTLIEEKLSRHDIQVPQRIHWLAAGVVVAPETHDEALESMVRGRDDRIREMASFFAPNNPLGFPGQDMNVTSLRSIIHLVGSIVGPEVDLDDPDDPELLASAQVEISIIMLSGLPGDDASRALDDLVGDDALVDWRADLERAQYRQRIVRRDASYSHPSLSEVRQTLSNLAPSNARDLAVLLSDKLNELAIRIRTANTDDWLQYWNEDSQGHPLKPKHEEHCRDALLSDLRGLLPDGVVAEPEGEYANDMRADIRVGFGDFNVPVEVKKDRNRQLWSSLNDQLIAKYASDPATEGHGIYLVFWFGDEHMPLPPEGPPPSNPVELRERLEALLTPADKHRISVCVVDVRPVK